MREELIRDLTYLKNEYGTQNLENILLFLENEDTLLYKEWKETINEIIQY